MNHDQARRTGESGGAAAPSLRSAKRAADGASPWVIGSFGGARPGSSMDPIETINRLPTG